MHGESKTSNQSEQLTTRPAITESIWFWVYLFSAASLIALILLGPKIGSRQQIKQRNYQARQQTYENSKRPEKPAQVGQKNSGGTVTAPLFIVMGVLFAISWGILWHQRFIKKWLPPDHAARDKTLASASLDNPDLRSSTEDSVC